VIAGGESLGFQLAIDGDEVGAGDVRQDEVLGVIHPRLVPAVAPGKTGDEIKAELAKREAEGGELGGPTGGRAGLLITIAAAVGAAVAVPAIGFAAGPIAVALAAAGAAGAAGALVTVFGDWGIPDDRVKGYESAIRAGQILMMVKARSPEDARALAEAWERAGGEDIHRA
jgi:hypothetical protein